MQHQTVPQHTSGTYRIAFDTVLGVDPITIPAPATAEAIAKQIEYAFAGAEIPRAVTVDVDLAGGQATIADDDGPFEWAPITHTPDYWLTLADDLRSVADRIATLAGTDRKPSWVSLGVQMAAPGNTDATVTEHVDTLVAAFGVGATTKKTPGGFHEYGVDTSRGALRLSLYAYVPAPEDPEKAALEARVAELEARLAEGGVR